MIGKYLKLASLGDVYKLTYFFDDTESFVNKTEHRYSYVRYNPRKNIQRYGLSVTSLDGKMNGIPDLDSLYEYNKENNTNIAEKDCNVPTQVYHEPEMKNLLTPFEGDLFRTHILRLDPGGFFPPHRDSFKNPECFRLLVPLMNCNPPNTYFILDGLIITNWELGRMYFVNTIKEHTLFNASFDSSYWLVLNINLNDATVNNVLNNLKVF